MEHCFNTGTPSLCEGKVYLAIEWGPKMPLVNLPFVNLELVGASFRKAEGPMPNKEEPLRVTRIPLKNVSYAMENLQGMAIKSVY